MNRNFEKFAAGVAPAVFVVLWSSGFIGTKYSVQEADPLTFLTIRMMYVILVLAVIAAIVRPKWPDRAGIGHSVVAGLLVHGFYLGGTSIGLHLHVSAGIAAL